MKSRISEALARSNAENGWQSKEYCSYSLLNEASRGYSWGDKIENA